MNDSLSSSPPFDVVILTFPDARAASAASRGPLWRSLTRRLPTTDAASVTLLATTDPWNCRVGSGGGTLSALAEARAFREQQTEASGGPGNTLIVHAGGQSSRCPTQMCFGKAWTTFPTGQDEGGGDLVTPIHIWLDFMFHRFPRLPAGSVAVIAADTLLRLPTSAAVVRESSLWDHSTAGVVVVTVPAPLTTAQNHGVFVLDDDDDDDPAKSGQLTACQRVLQKPSLETLRELTSSNHDNNQAWIDTGVLLFLPPAARALRALIEEPGLYGCTGVGLERLLHQRSAGGDDDDRTAFAAQHGLSIDLYTHMLQAFRLGDARRQQPMTYQAYRDRFPELPSEAARSLYEHLSPLTLQVWAEPDGRFLHLGTTVELMDFYTSSCVADPDNPERWTPLRSFARDLNLRSRQHVMAVSTGAHPPVCAEDCVMYHSVLQTENNLKIGTESLVEFCQLQCSDLHIGDHCWVSGLRGTWDGKVTIPNGVVVQELILTQETRVYMVLGVDDPVKSASRLYGRPWEEVTARLGLADTDLWHGDTQTLWNAKLHPVFRTDECHCFPRLFAWLTRLESNEILQADASLLEWLQRPRLSLAEIRQQANASLEFAFREHLSTHEIPAARTRMYTQTLDHLPSQVDYQSCTEDRANEMLQNAWQKLYGHLLTWISNGMYDLVGMSARRYASALEAMGKLASDQTVPVDGGAEGLTETDVLQNLLGRPLNIKLKTVLNDVNTKLDRRPGNVLSVDNCKTLAKILLAVSAACTRVCVGRDPLDGYASANPSAIQDRWIVATAPARIDIAGGWSDTPPICFEHGSVVTGVAVLVDGCAPLACRVRVTTNGSGVLLRSESRASDGELISTNDVELSKCDDLGGFNDPTSNCALLKCALVCLGFLSIDQILEASDTIDFAACVRRFFGTETPVRVEIISTSILPQGSGMGTSSILAGCILAAIAHCRGTPLTSSSIIHLTLELEQRLTTGGGFQDQANGLIGGAKRVSCTSGVVQSVRVDWKVLSLTAETEERLNECLYLVYTGQTRLAKNILQQCLYRWSERTVEICEAVSNLVETAETSTRALELGDLDAVGSAMKEYWEQKKIMAGSFSGVEPPQVSRILESLYRRNLIRCGTLCGAGGGGFLALLSKDGVNAEAMLDGLKHDGVEASEFTWHRVQLDPIGLAVHHVNENDFNLSFLRRD